VLACAPLLGRRFDWTVLAAATGLNDEQVLGALRQAVDVQLVDADDAEFRFRHALTHDGVLASLLAAEVAALAAQTRRALEVAQPGLPGAACVLAAELAEAAGEAENGAVLFVTAARAAVTWSDYSDRLQGAEGCPCVAAADPRSTAFTETDTR
jgi:hypothetical protein